VARLCTDAGPALETGLAGDPATLEWATTPAATAWVRVEVRLAAHPGEMVALTNPVFLGPLRGRPPA
jgi:hypothetical protein